MTDDELTQTIIGCAYTVHNKLCLRRVLRSKSLRKSFQTVHGDDPGMLPRQIQLTLISYHRI